MRFFPRCPSRCLGQRCERPRRHRGFHVAHTDAISDPFPVDLDGQQYWAHTGATTTRWLTPRARRPKSVDRNFVTPEEHLYDSFTRLLDARDDPTTKET